MPVPPSRGRLPGEPRHNAGTGTRSRNAQGRVEDERALVRTLTLTTYPSAGCGALGVVRVVALHPAHQLAQLAPRGLDRMLLALRPQLLELRRPGILVADEPPHHPAAVDVLQDRLFSDVFARVDQPG